MSKKLIIIISFIVLAAAAGGYFFLSKNSNPTGTATKETGVIKLSDDVVLSPVLSYDNKSIWYFNSKGQLFRRTISGSSLTEYTLPSPISDFKSASWPPAGTDFIVASADGSKNYYDSKNNNYKLLPENIQSFDWMPEGQRIVYVWKSGDGKSQQLMVANSDATGYRLIKNVFWPDLSVKISPDGKYALMLRLPAPDINPIYLVNLETGEFKTLIDAGKNTGVKWLTATKFAFVRSENGTNRSMLYDTTANQSVDLNLDSSLEKIAPDRGSMYYVANDGRSDAIWKMDLSTNQKSLFQQLDLTTHPKYLFVNNGLVCFVATDGKIYYIQ